MITGESPKFQVGEVIRRRGGRTAWRIESIDRGKNYYLRHKLTYQCVSLTSGRHEEYSITDPWLEMWTGPLPQPPATPILVKGHRLLREGGPFNLDGTYTNLQLWRRSGEGRGLCSCGAMSDVLQSANARKQWHKDHKSAMYAQQQVEAEA